MSKYALWFYLVLATTLACAWLTVLMGRDWMHWRNQWLRVELPFWVQPGVHYRAFGRVLGGFPEPFFLDSPIVWFGDGKSMTATFIEIRRKDLFPE